MYSCKRFVSYVLTLLSGWLIMQLCSCVTDHYEYPQPVDASNIYEFPKALRGIWTDSTSTDKIFLIIKKKSLFITAESEKIYNGILDSKAIHRKGLKRILYNDDNIPVDTLTDYIIRGDKIYAWGAHHLQPGKLFTVKNDTIYPQQDTLHLYLGPDHFLRKISKESYVLNISEDNFTNRLIHGGGQARWWQVVFLHITQDGNLKIKLPSTSDLNDENIIERKTEDLYLNIRWTTKDLNQIIFEDSVFDGAEAFYKLKRNRIYDF